MMVASIQSSGQKSSTSTHKTEINYDIDYKTISFGGIGMRHVAMGWGSETGTKPFSIWTESSPEGGIHQLLLS